MIFDFRESSIRSCKQSSLPFGDFARKAAYARRPIVRGALYRRELPHILLMVSGKVA